MDMPLFTQSNTPSLSLDVEISNPSAESSDLNSMSVEMAQGNPKWRTIEGWRKKNFDWHNTSDSNSFSGGLLTPIDSQSSQNMQSLGVPTKPKESSLFREIVSVKSSGPPSSSQLSLASKREESSETFAVPLARPRKPVKLYGGSLPLRSFLISTFPSSGNMNWN